MTPNPLSKPAELPEDILAKFADFYQPEYKNDEVHAALLEGVKWLWRTLLEMSPIAEEEFYKLYEAEMETDSQKASAYGNAYRAHLSASAYYAAKLEKANSVAMHEQHFRIEAETELSESRQKVTELEEKALFQQKRIDGMADEGIRMTKDLMALKAAIKQAIVHAGFAIEAIPSCKCNHASWALENCEKCRPKAQIVEARRILERARNDAGMEKGDKGEN